MEYQLREKRLFVAIDESNHGRDEEIFVAAFSYTGGLAGYERFTARQKDRREIAAKMRTGPRLDYRFCVVNREYYELLGEHNIQREVLRVFFNNFLDNKIEVDASDIFIDGEFQRAQREDAREAVRKIINKRRGVRDKIPYPTISIHGCPKTQGSDGTIRANRLLLFADFQSHKLFDASRYSTADRRGKYFSRRVSFPLKA